MSYIIPESSFTKDRLLSEDILIWKVLKSNLNSTLSNIIEKHLEHANNTTEESNNTQQQNDTSQIIWL